MPASPTSSSKKSLDPPPHGKAGSPTFRDTMLEDECPLFPFETIGEGLEFVYKRLVAKNESALREQLGDPLTHTVDLLKQENADLKLRLEAMRRDKKTDPGAIFPLYENVISRQVARNKEVASFLRKTQTQDLNLITRIGELADRLEAVGMEDKRLFELNRSLVQAQQKMVAMQNGVMKLQSDKRNLEYREKNLQIANQLLKGKADEAHAKMLHFKALYAERQKELDSLANSSNFIALLSENKEIVGKREAGPQGGEEMWKRGFDQVGRRGGGLWFLGRWW